MPTPLLIISDAPTSGTGLGRITRDLALRIAKHLPEFRVATLGYGGPYTSKLPFHQYNMEMSNWVIYNLPEVWQDFAGEENGIVMTIWDASRLLWLARPENCDNPVLQKFLKEATFQRWGYFPIDATGPNDRLTVVIKHTIEGYDRVLAYSKWAERILQRTLWKKPLLENLDSLPHGIDTSVFHPWDKKEARATFGERIGMRNQAGKWLAIPDDFYTVGIVATNQTRKDFGLAFQILANLTEEKKGKILVWVHTDRLENSWGLPALIHDYGTKNHAIVVVPLTDEQMAQCYSACDITLGIGLGEGFGYPIFESLACGVPCFHGDYAGAAEHLPDAMKVQPATFHLETPYNCYRPVFTREAWLEKINQWPNADKVRFPEHLDWNNLWPRWAEWLRKGL